MDQSVGLKYMKGSHVNQIGGYSSIQIDFLRDEIYRIIKVIISHNYGRNPFVYMYPLDKGIKYNFTFRGEEVCISLHDSQPGTLNISKNGQVNWYNGAVRILDKQVHERLLSGEWPKANTDKNKKLLVKEEDFRKCFANPYAYGRESRNPWPSSTILLYKYSSNATTKYLHIPENTWIRINNTGIFGMHAELILIEDLKNIQDYLTIQPDDYEGSYKAILSVEVILSYSPYYKCAQALCQVKNQLDEEVKQSKTRNKDPDTVTENLSALSRRTTEIDELDKIKFKITFSNFYMHLEKHFSGTKNMEGLKSLLKSDIKLDIFTDENWDYFFNAAGLVTERPRRRRRERDDKKILQYLEELVTYERMPAALKAMEEELRKDRLL